MGGLVGCFDIVADRSASGEAHPRTEGNGEVLGAIPEAAEPFPLVLENSLTRQAMGAHDGIQARFGGVGLPPAIVQFNPGVADLSDQVTVQANLSDSIDVGNAGVGALPVGASGDSGIHLAFDLSHVRWCAVWVWRERSGLIPLHSSKIHDFGGLCQDCGQFGDCHRSWG